MPSYGTWSAVNILKFNGYDADVVFVLDYSALDNLLTAASLSDDTQISIVSIAGEYRSGKSFFLNLLARYLSSNEIAGQPIPSDWWTSEDKDEEFFEWRGGTDTCTFGIWIWPQPFPIGHNHVLFLMDTEGLFDPHCDSMRMLSFSMLFSSLQIFNIRGGLIPQNLWDSLAVFIEAMKKSSTNSSNISLLPKITFLCRDWSCPQTFEFGWNGGCNYLHKQLTNHDNAASATVDVLKCVQENLRSTNCFLMPRPGDEVAEQGDCIAISQLEFADRFKRFFSEFCVGLFANSTNIPVKVNEHGQPLRASQFAQFAESMVRAVCENAVPESVLTSYRSQVEREAADRALNEFVKILEMRLRLCEGDLIFLEAVDAAIDEAKMIFVQSILQEHAASSNEFERNLCFLRDTFNQALECMKYKISMKMDHHESQSLMELLRSVSDEVFHRYEDQLPTKCADILRRFLDKWCASADKILDGIVKVTKEAEQKLESIFDGSIDDENYVALKESVTDKAKNDVKNILIRHAFLRMDGTYFDELFRQMVSDRVRLWDSKHSDHSRLFRLVCQQTEDSKARFERLVKSEDISSFWVKSNWENHLEKAEKQTMDEFHNRVRTVEASRVVADQQWVLREYCGQRRQALVREFAASKNLVDELLQGLRDGQHLAASFGNIVTFLPGKAARLMGVPTMCALGLAKGAVKYAVNKFG